MFLLPSSDDDQSHLYDGILLTTNTSGVYTFRSLDEFGSAGLLYYPTFNAFDSSSNMIAGDYDDRIVQGFDFIYSLEANQQYYLIVTNRRGNETGSFNATIRGASPVQYTRLDCKLIRLQSFE